MEAWRQLRFFFPDNSSCVKLVAKQYADQLNKASCSSPGQKEGCESSKIQKVTKPHIVSETCEPTPSL